MTVGTGSGFFASSTSFGMIRGGMIDVAIEGPMQFLAGCVHACGRFPMKTAMWNAHYARGWIVGEVSVVGVGSPKV